MAVEIVNSGNKEYLEVLYHFDDEKLTPFSPTLFHFAQSTTSNILFLDEKYTATKIHLTKKLHEKTTNNRLFDMVIECQGIEQLTKKMFICIGLEFNRPGGTFIIQSPDFGSVFSQFKPTVLYQTKTGNFVVVTNYTLLSENEAPTQTISAKAAYKEIIEPDSFHELSTVNVAKPSLQKVLTKTSNVVFKAFLKEERETKKEGFKTRSAKEFRRDKRKRRERRRAEKAAAAAAAAAAASANPSGTGLGGSYMDCKLLKENSNEAYEDVAVVPLKTNVYERGMVTFSHFLHFFLVSVGAGLGFPNLLVTAFTLDNFRDPDTGGRTGTGNLVGGFSFCLFFVLGLLLMIVGLAAPKYRSKKKNDKGIKDGSVLATVGFYFVLIHCSFALGMFTFKKFGTLTYDDKFVAMFSNTDLTWGSFFNILEGLRTKSKPE